MIRSAFISIITLLRREDTALTSLLTPLAQPSNFEAAFASLLPPSSPKERRRRRRRRRRRKKRDEDSEQFSTAEGEGRCRINWGRVGRTFAGMEDHHTRLATPGGSLDPGETAVCGPLAPGGGWEKERERERGSTRRAVSALNRFHFRPNFPNGSAQVGNMRSWEPFFGTIPSLKYLILESLHFSNV